MLNVNKCILSDNINSKDDKMKQEIKKIKGLSLIAVLILLFANGSVVTAKTGDEKVVTASLSLYTGSSTIFAQYLGDQEYTGSILGVAAEFGSMYKRSENLSWDIDLTYLGLASGVFQASNPAETSAYGTNRINADYGTYYNWNPVKNLYIKAGGSFDVLFANILAGPDHVNNMLETDLQTQLKAGAGIKYGWNFKKTGIFLQANLEVPFMGIALSGTQYESSLDALIKGEILAGTINPFCFTSFHNLTGFNADIEAEFVLKKTTIFMTYEMNHRAWKLYDLNNTRKYNMIRLGLRVDLAAHNRVKSGNRYF